LLIFFPHLPNNKGKICKLSEWILNDTSLWHEVWKKFNSAKKVITGTFPLLLVLVFHLKCLRPVHFYFFPTCSFKVTCHILIGEMLFQDVPIIWGLLRMLQVRDKTDLFSVETIFIANSSQISALHF
jgi:hypothetical protein